MQPNQLSNLINYSLLGFASELKCLNEFVNIDEQINTSSTQTKIFQFTPGTYSIFSYNNSIWSNIKQNIPYFIPTFSSSSNKIYWV